MKMRKFSGILIMLALPFAIGIPVRAESYELEDGTTYEGTMIDGKRQGFGILRAQDESWRSEGFWYDDVRQGPYTRYEEDCIYQSILSDGNQTGAILYRYTNGDIAISDDRQNGLGIRLDQEQNVVRTGAYNNKQYEEKEFEIWSENGVTYYADSKTEITGGRAIAVYENGDVYVGQFINKEPEGRGAKYYLEDDYWYTGNWAEGEWNGDGICFGSLQKTEDGTTSWWYRRSLWDDYSWTGATTEYNSKGTRFIYTRNSSNQKWGVIIEADGTIEIGEWDENGTFINLKEQVWEDNDGCRYIGEKGSNGEINGYGLHVHSGGNIYIGNFSNGKRNGNGLYYFFNTGNYYEGEHSNQRFSGTGTYFWSDFSVNHGAYVGDRRNGENRYIEHNGNILEGFYQENQLKTGKYIQILDDGSRNVTVYEDGKKVEGEAGIKVYSEAGYYGRYAVFEPGEYKMADLVQRGISNDSISSISIPDGYFVTVYHNDGCQGIRHTYTAHVDFTVSGENDQTRWNDTISSFVVKKTED